MKCFEYSERLDAETPSRAFGSSRTNSYRRSMDRRILERQHNVCERYGAEHVECPADMKLGILLSERSGGYPIHGLRHPTTGNTTGWFIWSGEFSKDPEFFVPLHVSHVKDWNPVIEPYLGLAPGWRFLITLSYEDVWYDVALLDI